jgi:hypothetical protein
MKRIRHKTNESHSPWKEVSSYIPEGLPCGLLHQVLGCGIELAVLVNGLDQELGADIACHDDLRR